MFCCRISWYNLVLLIVNCPSPEASKQPPQRYIPTIIFHNWDEVLMLACSNLWQFFKIFTEPVFQQCCGIIMNSCETGTLVVSPRLQCFADGKFTHIIKFTISLLKHHSQEQQSYKISSICKPSSDYGWMEGQVWKFLCNPSSLMNFYRSLSEVY